MPTARLYGGLFYAPMWHYNEHSFIYQGSPPISAGASAGAGAAAPQCPGALRFSALGAALQAAAPGTWPPGHGHRLSLVVSGQAMAAPCQA